MFCRCTLIVVAERNDVGGLASTNDNDLGGLTIVTAASGRNLPQQSLDPAIDHNNIVRERKAKKKKMSNGFCPPAPPHSAVRCDCETLTLPTFSLSHGGGGRETNHVRQTRTRALLRPSRAHFRHHCLLLGVRIFPGLCCVWKSFLCFLFDINGCVTTTSVRACV